MRVLRIILLAVVLVIAVIALGGFVVFTKWTRGPLPQLDGDLSISGLNAKVEILRDNWGIPHIYASTTHDLFFAQGFTQAQDRWWQMEFSRHIGKGTIEELTGKNKSVISNDVFIRKIGWWQAAQRDLKAYDANSLAVLQAFADGVNAYIQSRDKSDLALEYNVLGLTGVNITIEPWTPTDSLVWAKVMAWNLSGNWDTEMLRSALYKRLGQDMTDEYMPPYPFGKKPTIVRAEDLPISDSSLTTQADTAGIIGTDDSLIRDIDAATNSILWRDHSLGSNNWVVSGSMTKSGKPLLANDPHLGIQMPSIWYEIGLHCQPVGDTCPYEVTGFALPATPGVVIGHNAHIAWGMTNVGPDTQDLYQIQVNPDNPLQYKWNGAWKDMTVRDEEIRFGDGKPSIKIQVREIPGLGPIINDNEIDDTTGEPNGFNNTDPLAFHWTATDPDNPGTILVAVLGFNRASNWGEFRAAAKFFDAPAQNLVFADTDGNIGYQTPGRIPIRAEGDSGLLPVDGSTDKYLWKGFIPFDDLPRILNPKRGYISTANQALVPLDYYDQLKAKLGDQYGANSNYIISQEWDYGYRGQRIANLLEKNAPHTIDTFKAIQGDDKNGSAEEMMPYLEKTDFGDATLNDARDWLKTWDFQMTMDSPQAAFYAEFWARLMDNLYNDQLGDDSSAAGGDMQEWATLLLMDKPDDAWWDDTRTQNVTEKRDDILIRSFKEGYDATVKALGSDRSKWSWGKLHTATFVSNPLGLSGIDLIEGIVNRGAVATSGGPAIVNATSWNASSGDFTVQSLPSMRMIVDLSDLSQSQTMHTTGESGHPYSSHYGDMIDSWRNIQYHPMLWTRDQVDKATANRLSLNP